MEQEERIIKMLVECWNEFLRLESQHPDEKRDFCDGIHRCQDILGMRFARQSRPDLFPIKSKTVTSCVDNKSCIGARGTSPNDPKGPEECSGV